MLHKMLRKKIRVHYSLSKGTIVRSESFEYTENEHPNDPDQDPIYAILRLNKQGPYCDESRSQAHFVVVDIKDEYNDGAHNDPPASAPSGRKITAKRLREDGSFDPNGESICFLRGYEYHQELVVQDSELEILGHMDLPS